MRSSAVTFFQKNLPTTVAKARTATTTYQLNSGTTMIIKHKPIRTFDDLLMTMIDHPLIGRMALAVAHKELIPADLKSLRDLFDVVDLNALHSTQHDPQMDFLSLLKELNRVRSERINEAYDYHPVARRV